MNSDPEMPGRHFDFDEDELTFLKTLGVSPEDLEARRRRCPELGWLLAADAGVLDEEIGVRLRGHLDRCATCRTLVRELGDGDWWGPTKAEEASIRARVMEPLRVRWSRAQILRWARWGGLAVAASVVLAIALGRQADVVLRPELPRVAPPGGAAASGGPAPASVLVLDKPAVELPTSARLVRRGEATALERFLTEFEPARASYVRSDYQDAARRFVELARQYPDWPDVHFALGVTRLWLGEPAEAARSLRDAQRLASDGLLRDRAVWYLALAHHRAGRFDEAVEALGHLCVRPNEFGTRACDGLRELLLQR